jgi:transposase-like protein
MSTEDYPKTQAEFQEKFATEEACWEYLVKMRWPNGFVCCRCNGTRAWLISRGLFECQCGQQTSVKVGTIFQGSRKPLRLGFNVMWTVVVPKTGNSANNLKVAMGFGSYQTVWMWLHKLRRAMIRPGRDRLIGEVEVDETYIGGVEKGKNRRGRGANSKTLVVVATECLGKKLGRVRFHCINQASEDELIPFINDYVEPGSTVITDGWEGYKNVGVSGYKHKKKTISGSGKNAHELLPHVHLVDALLKKWINGTHQGAINKKYLQYYLDEYSFRFNRRLSKYRGKLFYRLIQQCIQVPPTTRKMIIGKEDY